MKLEASLFIETRVGMNQIQSQLENLTIQLQDAQITTRIIATIHDSRDNFRGEF